MPKRLAAVLKAARESSHLSVTELSARSGVSRAMIDEIERGKNVSVDTLERIARSLGLEYLPISDITLEVSDAMVSYVRDVARRISQEASELFDRVGRDARPVIHAIADRAANVLPFASPRLLTITFTEEQQVDELRQAFANSPDAEFRTPFRGKKKHLVPRGIDVAAGAGAELLAPTEEEEQLREIPEHYWEERGARMILRARGNSLIGRGIVDRDLLFIKPTTAPKTGEVIACRVNDQAYVKIFEKKGNRVRLLSATSDFRAVEVSPSDSFQCFGVVVGRSGYGLQFTESVK